MKRLLVCIVAVYSLAIVMLGTTAYLNHAFPKQVKAPLHLEAATR